MSNFLSILILTFALFLSSFAHTKGNQIDFATAVVEKSKKVQVEGVGNVIKILPDDTHGSKHQKFIIRTPEGTSVLIAHNIDLAKRIINLKRGDTVHFFGEYVWNEKGGVVHWTHHDPDGRHIGGWLKHKGVIYQ
ncbi:MAG: DUF3465 domain-containing protein [Moraxellaceae bacterium]|nr:MAG: DUF3465 domain-containing protein [Moraxellaceae bacterium]